MKTVNETKTNGPKDLKKKRESPPRRSPREIFQQGAGSSGVLVRDPVTTLGTCCCNFSQGQGRTNGEKPA
jgi:hypothetical protein